MFSEPHFVRDYIQLVRTLRKQHDLDTAMSLAVGGHYEGIGQFQLAVLNEAGLRDGDFLIDVGCGSGRTAYALRDRNIRYLGIDVVPDLIDYARQKVVRPDWKFAVVKGLSIPASEGVADMVTFFSVLTHLTWKEGQQYLQEALRVLKPDGTLIFSFLDQNLPSHREMAGSWFKQVRGRLRGNGVKSVMLTQDEIREWAAKLKLAILFHGPEALGQSYCVVRRQ
jgi:ubiquinone/menaquinone biosynthesis C-methylase UbiE